MAEVGVKFKPSHTAWFLRRQDDIRAVQSNIAAVDSKCVRVCVRGRVVHSLLPRRLPGLFFF